jgi:uncharacterized protein YbjT (DUF2867 family)
MSGLVPLVAGEEDAVADGGPNASAPDQQQEWKRAVPISLVVLVIGATRGQGGAVARRLLERGHRVRAFARSADSSAGRELERLGAKVWSGSFDDPDSVWRAARGADAVFAMSTPFEAGFEAEVRQGANVLEAAKDAGVRHLIYSSVAGANRGTGIPHFETKAELERRLAGLDLSHTILAPVAFMESLLAPGALATLGRGALTAALPPSRPLQQLALADLASCVALVLEQRERFLGRRIEIASDELTGVEQALILSEVCGREIRCLELPLERMRGFGEDAALTRDWLDAVGYGVDIEALRRDYPEVGWRTFGEWARSQDWRALIREVPA